MTGLVYKGLIINGGLGILQQAYRGLWGVGLWGVGLIGLWLRAWGLKRVFGSPVTI